MSVSLAGLALSPLEPSTPNLLSAPDSFRFVPSPRTVLNWMIQKHLLQLYSTLALLPMVAKLHFPSSSLPGSKEVLSLAALAPLLLFSFPAVSAIFYIGTYVVNATLDLDRGLEVASKCTLNSRKVASAAQVWVH